MYDSTILAQILWTSTASAGFQVLFTIAFALVLKVNKIWNFTQPALMGIAFYAMYVVVNPLDGPVLAGVALALVSTGAAAYGIERLAFATLRERNSGPIAFFIFTLVFAQFAIYVLTLVFTTEPRFMLKSMIWPMRLVAGVVVSDWDLLAIAIPAVLAAALYLFLRFARPGQFMIAVADNADLAEIYGIDKQAAFRLAMVIAAILITAAMYLFGARLALFPELTLHVMIFAVAATILGGIGNIFGAGVAALSISILQQFSVLVVDSRWQPLLVSALLFVAIVFFPQGVKFKRRPDADGRAGLPAMAGPPRPAE